MKWLFLLFLLSPTLVFSQSPMDTEETGDISKYISLIVQVNEMGVKRPYRVVYKGDGERWRPIKDENGRDFKFNGYPQIIIYMDNQGYDFFLQVPSYHERQYASTTYGTFVFKKRE